MNKQEKQVFDQMREAMERMLALWDRTRESGALPLDYVRCKATLTVANAVSEQQGQEPTL